MKLLAIYNYLCQRTVTIDFKGVFYAIFYSKKNKLKKSDVLFICHDNHRTTYIDELRYSPIIDTISDDIDSKITKITLVGPFSKHFGKTCYGNVVMYNRTLLFAYIKRLVFMQSLTLTNIKTDPVVKVWSFILKIIQPKIIIGINPSPELCIAAKYNKIWIADIQHGVLDPGNYYGLKKRENISQNGWPNAILCWDQFSKDYVDSNLSPFVEAMIVENPAIFSKASKKLVCVQKNSAQKVNNQLSVLVTLTWSDEFLEDDIYLKQIGFPSSLINFIKNHGDFCIWNIRIHPVMFANKTKRVYAFSKLSSIFKGNTNVLWEQCNNETIYSALNKCSVHITYHSAAARDAANIGIHTAVLDTRREDVSSYFEDLIKEGIVTLCTADNNQDFKKWIINSSNIKSNPKKTNSLIQEGARFKSFIEYIESIINKH